jgi:hypothetical protein
MAKFGLFNLFGPGNPGECVCLCFKPLRDDVFFRSCFFGKTREDVDDGVVVEQDVNRI